MVVDASVILMAFFPDEFGHAQAQALIQSYALGEVELHAPTLLPYEIANAVLQAVHGGRILPEMADEIVSTFENLDIALHAVPPADALALAVRHERSAYDAAYLALAETLDARLVTGNRRLYNAVRLPYMLWIGDYQSPPI